MIAISIYRYISSEDIYQVFQNSQISGFRGGPVLGILGAKKKTLKNPKLLKNPRFKTTFLAIFLPKYTRPR